MFLCGSVILITARKVFLSWFQKFCIIIIMHFNFEFQVEQLHKIFKLCGTPSEEYWKVMKLPAVFRTPHHCQPGFPEAFAEFPPSSVSLLTTLLALDPSSRGSAASALQSEVIYYLCSNFASCNSFPFLLVKKTFICFLNF